MELFKDPMQSCILYIAFETLSQVHLFVVQCTKPSEVTNETVRGFSKPTQPEPNLCMWKKRTGDDKANN